MIDVREVTKVYRGVGGPIEVFSGVTFALREGEAAAITGPSGSGKSSLLYILGALDRPTAGSVQIDGLDPYALDERALARFRNQTVGFVFQDHCLLPQCTVLENVLTPTLAGPRAPGAADRARQLLARVGLGDRLHHRPAALSGGERQRVAMARALVNQPRVLLCDEPTGNLDRRSADGIGALLAEMQHEHGATLLVVTHNPDLARRLPRRFELAGGRLVPQP